MHTNFRRIGPSLAVLIMAWTLGLHAAQPGPKLPGTDDLTASGDLSALMVDGIRKFLLREIDLSHERRSTLWKRNLSSAQAFDQSIAPNRERLARYIGAMDPRLPMMALDYVGSTELSSKWAESEGCAIYAVRWQVFSRVYGEGLLLQPKTTPRAAVVVLPDADQTPESLAGLGSSVPLEHQIARRLAESGCLVVVPALVDRSDIHSGNRAIHRFTNQPHREWLYRQAYQMGRHPVGYEVQKVRSLLDWMERFKRNANLKLGVWGWGEGGLIALHTGALDPRLDVIGVSGHFGPRNKVWEEPIYRNIWGGLEEFPDAELAAMAAPRHVIIEAVPGPVVAGPPPARPGRSGAAPGKLSPIPVNEVQTEVQRASTLVPQIGGKPWGLTLVIPPDPSSARPGTEPALREFLTALGIPALRPAGPLTQSRPIASEIIYDRQQRTLEELVDHTQHLLLISERTRQSNFWSQLKAEPDWSEKAAPHRDRFWNEVIGKFPPASLPANPRSRLSEANARWASYDVMLDVWPDVFAWGLLLLPTDLKPGEKRPVVVCQHGLEGVPVDTVNPAGKPGYDAYKSYAAKLAERGFIVFAPHNPYRGMDRFRVLQRMANPLRKSLFSVIIAQHERILDWLESLPFVDSKRIGFYGLSYGGKTAMRVPAVAERYCLSICSADFNEWIKKNATIESGYSYLYTIEYEMPEFDLGNTFNYAEMAGLIAPRPFMVERGHDDGVAPDEWVAHEYAKVRRLFAKLGLPGKTEIEFFNGPHTINGQATYDFLHRHLDWPKR